jgi:hypothetical protein
MKGPYRIESARPMVSGIHKASVRKPTREARVVDYIDNRGCR